MERSKADVSIQTSPPPPTIVNLSITGEANEQADAVFQSAIDAGITIIVAAGNQNGNACTRSPARLADAITVAATDYSLVEGPQGGGGEAVDIGRRDLSNTGPCVTLWAPGSDIRSAAVAGNTATIVKSGTSVAAPLVAGALAMYHQFGLGMEDLLEHTVWLDELAGDDETTGQMLSLTRLNTLALETSSPSTSTVTLEDENTKGNSLWPTQSPKPATSMQPNTSPNAPSDVASQSGTKDVKNASSAAFPFHSRKWPTTVALIALVVLLLTHTG